MTLWTFIGLVMGCAVVTWLPRIIPFILVKKVQLPTIVLKWLKYIPVCILSALVFESFFEQQANTVHINWTNVLAFVPTCVIAVWTKSLSITVVLGVLTMAALRYVGL